MNPALYVALWIPFAALWGLGVYLERGALLFAVVAGVCVIGTAASLGVAVWRISGRYPWPGESFRDFIGVHALFASLYVTCLIAVEAFLGGFIDGRSMFAFIARHPSWVLFELVIYSWLYGLVAGVSYSARGQRLLQDRELAVARAEAHAKEAQLRVLRTQLNPHFLFNALNSVAALVRHDSHAAEQALDELGQLLRYALHEGSAEDVRLADEWQFVRHYLALESLRLGDRLQVASELDPDALACVVPAFVMQPLVENAVRHGIAPRSRGGCLAVQARVTSQQLVLTVSDDGIGAAESSIEHNPGFGLRALRKRLEARFKGGYRMQLATAPGAGFAVTVTLPARSSIS